jgi:hypothetical protein
LHSSVHRWPDADAVVAAARRWAEQLAAHAPQVVAVGVFGSYARGDVGVRSDLDLIVIARDGQDAVDPADDRWAVENMPVPTERVVLSWRQWAQHREQNTRFYRTLLREARWLVGAPPEPP